MSHRISCADCDSSFSLELVQTAPPPKIFVLTVVEEREREREREHDIEYNDGTGQVHGKRR